MGHSSKFFIILSIVLVTLAYGIYERDKFRQLTSSRDLILQRLPAMDVDLYLPSGDVQRVSERELLATGEHALMLHLWASWCGICKDGMPEIISFAQKLESEGVALLLLAVNDQREEFERYLDRFSLPPNVFFALDLKENTMDRLGSARIPETYLFASDGQHLNKFVGPQEWSRPTYFDRVTRQVKNSRLGRGQEVQAHQ